jgi:hypothetical protein
MPFDFPDHGLPGVMPTCPPGEYIITPRPPRKDKLFKFINVWGRRDLAKLIETCPGPWPADEPLPSDAEVMGAIWNRSMVGYIVYRRDEVECPTTTIFRVAVLPGWQRKGAGRFLVHWMERSYFPYLSEPEVRGRWEPTVRAVTRVPKTCIKGRLFFGSLGFRVLPGWGTSDTYALERTRTLSGGY